MGPGQHRVDADLRGELVGEALRQPQHRPSDGVREDEPVQNFLDRPGGDRHDGPAAAGRQRRVSGPNRPHDAHDEQVVGVVPLAVVGVEKRPRRRPAGARDHVVQPPERLDCPLDERLDVVAVGDVCPDRAHVAVAGRTEALLGAVESVPVAAADGDVAPGLREGV